MIERITYLLVMVSLCLLPLVGMFSIDSTNSNILRRHMITNDEITQEYERISNDNPEVLEAYEKYKESYGYASYTFEYYTKTDNEDKSEIKFDNYVPDNKLTEDEIKKIKDSLTTNEDSSLDGILGGSGSGSGGGSGKGIGDGTGAGDGTEDFDAIELFFEIDDTPGVVSDGANSEGGTVKYVGTYDGDDDGDDDPGPEATVETTTKMTVSQTKNVVISK